MDIPPNILNGYDLAPSRNLNVNLPYIWDTVSNVWVPDATSPISSNYLLNRAEKSIHKFGNNPSVSNQVSSSSPETIWDGSNEYVFPPDSGVNIQVSSSENVDLQELIIEGLDQNFKEQSWTGSLSGTGEVNVSGSWSRVFRAFNNDSVYLSGDVNIYESGNSSLSYAKILNKKDQTLMAVYTVPDNFTGYLNQYHISAQNPSNANEIGYTVEIRTREFGKVFRTKEIASVTTTSLAHQEFPYPEVLPPKTDIIMNIISSNGANGSVNADFDITLI